MNHTRSTRTAPAPIRMKTNCPHCGYKCRQMYSEQLSPLLREVTYRCENLDCGFAFVAAVEPVREISPSGTPNPDVRLPLSLNHPGKKTSQSPASQIAANA